MKKNGFTLVEVLAVLIILALLIAISIPAYMFILRDVKRDNYRSKITEIETAANKYGEKIKDEIKSAGNSCYHMSIADLIHMGELISESDKEDVMYNTTDNKPMLGDILICYSTSDFDIHSYYTVEFNKDTIYHKGDKVSIYDETNEKVLIYECVHDYPGNGSRINETYEEDGKQLPYFEEIIH